MAEELDLRTATMAKLLVNQGHYRKAADIYRYLAQQNPDPAAYANVLADLKHKIEQQARSRDLAALIQKWVSLLLKVEQLRYLRQVRENIDVSRRI